MVFEMIFSFQSFRDAELGIDGQATAPVIEETIPPPPWRDILDEISYDGIAVNALHLAEV